MTNVHTEFLRVIQFAIAQGIEASEFLDAWMHGGTEDWPEFTTHPQATEPALSCARCGATTGQACNDMGCGYLEAGNGEPAPSAEVERWEPVEEMREQMDDMARIISTNAFYQEGHKDGLEWAAQCVEYNDPRTGDWMWDDRNDLANAIRKGPEMPAIHPALPAAAMPVGELILPEKRDISEFDPNKACSTYFRGLGWNEAIDVVSKLLAAASTQPVREPLTENERIKEFLRKHKSSALPDGACITCEGEGEIGGQFSGGIQECPDCAGSGKAAHGIK